ncbi:Fic family protein [Neorhizobium sp. T7_12]|uniref:Fic family protein n=1 Tax=Neorhizobium sp. T7_12 TaxID=2093832 RepID=UPI000CF927A8|nr:Fic family protein [Neorhizobium sp. T7_12]
MEDWLIPCPGNWEYEHHPNYKHEILSKRTANLLYSLRMSSIEQKLKAAQDTRPIHAVFFEGLTPKSFDYYAGHYRGEAFRCLDTYNVGVAGDSRVGHAASVAPAKMYDFASKMKEVFNELHLIQAVPEKMFPPAHKLFRAIELAAGVFVYFLEIHPYANGNGHMGRFIMQAVLGRNDIYFNSSFQTHPRPNEPAYTRAIVAYRNGSKQALHQLLLSCI